MENTKKTVINSELVFYYIIKRLKHGEFIYEPDGQAYSRDELSEINPEDFPKHFKREEL